MTLEQLANWRQRLGLSTHIAAIKLGISSEDYEWYENGFSVIPKSIELATFTIELSEYFFLKAREQNPKFRHQGIGYAYTKSDFVNKLLNERKLIQDISLNKGDELFVRYKSAEL